MATMTNYRLSCHSEERHEVPGRGIPARLERERSPSQRLEILRFAQDDSGFVQDDSARRGKLGGAVFGIIAVLMVALPANAFANFCAQDQVPSATLLFPYIAVDLKSDGTPDFAGQTTLARVTNVAPAAAIVNFTVWDVTGIPRIDFGEILSGYDVLQINWRDFTNGRLDLFDTSKTAFTTSSSPYSYPTSDPFEWGPDGRGQRGGLTTPANRNAITSNQCASVPPYGNRSDLAVVIRNVLSASAVAHEHAGCPDPADLRADQDSWTESIRPSPLVFFATADVVKVCNLYFPNNTAYWADSIMTTQNVLLGDVIYFNPTAATSEMMPAVHIEAAAGAGGGASVTGFYEEKTSAETYREPLPTAFMLSYTNDPDHGLRSNLIFWKNFSELDDEDKVNDCGSYVYYAWDMDERSLSPSTPMTSTPSAMMDRNQLPFMTQKVPLDQRYFDLPGTSGWLLLVLPPSYGGEYVDPTSDGKGYLARPYMGWAALQLSFGTYSAGSEAITVGNALCFPSQTLPALGVNDGTTPIR